MTAQGLAEYLAGLRTDPAHSLGGGDVRLTLAQQDALLEQVRALEADRSDAVRRHAALIESLEARIAGQEAAP